jgi:hypothetical protein
VNVVRAVWLFLLVPALPACGSSSKGGFVPDTNTNTDKGGATDADPAFSDDGVDPAAASTVAEVYGHSSDTLYKLDPDTKAVTVIGKFHGCSDVIDIALDASARLFATTTDAIWRINKATAGCSRIGHGTFPNSLSFVPKGTVDANGEALVGYDDGDYVRIDTQTGVKTKIGSIGGGFSSSGDIVSVKGGPTYLTVKGPGCNDCILEVDPSTGAMKKNWGSIKHVDVYGLAFWAGSIYGFDDGGELFEVKLTGSAPSTTPITMPAKPFGLSFWGAGSTTSAPLAATK